MLLKGSTGQESIQFGMYGAGAVTFGSGAAGTFRSEPKPKSDSELFPESGLEAFPSSAFQEIQAALHSSTYVHTLTLAR